MSIAELRKRGPQEGFRSAERQMGCVFALTFSCRRLVPFMPLKTDTTWDHFQHFRTAAKPHEKQKRTRPQAWNRGDSMGGRRLASSRLDAVHVPFVNIGELGLV